MWPWTKQRRLTKQAPGAAPISAGGDFFGDTAFTEQYPDDSFLARITGTIEPGAGTPPLAVTSYTWERIEQLPDGTHEDSGGAGFGSAVSWPAVEASGSADVATGAIVRLRKSFGGSYMVFVASAAGSSSFLALLTGKDYTGTDVDGSGNKFTAYSWERLDDSDDPDPLTYDETDPPQSGGPCDFPAYHEQENDLPVSLRGQVVICLVTEGGATNEVQSVAVQHATGGTFTLTFDGQTTAAINYDAAAAAVETALENLSNITNVTVTGSGTPASPFLVTFMDSTANVPLMTANGASLTPDGGIYPHSVVRLRRGAGDYYLIEQLPFEDLFERTEDSDADGVIGYHRIWNQQTQAWVRGIEVRIVTAD